MTTAAEALDLSLVLPAFNEAGNIERVVEDAAAYLDTQGIRYEIHVVDDGSHDDTPRVLERLSCRAPALRVLRHPRNRGYGAALRTGLAAVRGEHVLIADGDGQFHIRGLAALWARRHEADLVLGFRNPRKDPLLRRVAGWLYGRVVVPAALGGRFRDVNCGFKLVRRRVIEGMELRATGALFSAELLTRARLAGATWVEVGVDHFPRRSGTATGLLPGVVLALVGELLRHRRAILQSEPAAVSNLRTGPDAVESASA
jgi:glycosyltransferase involved in cell wall biosynthesis